MPDSFTKTAVILFNLGGPGSLDEVRPFLFSMFRDKAILRLPQPFRLMLAWWIAARRAPVASAIYEKLGGASPILKETEAQARALETKLGNGYKVFIAMRYTSPRAAEAAERVKEYAPNQIILLPLYPQFSTTTTESSLKEWERLKSDIPTRILREYPTAPGFIAAHRELLRDALGKAPEDVRILFSAHGLPQRIVDAGDPYPEQVRQSADAVMAAFPERDYAICYQSRVGRLKWLEPSTDAEIRRAGREGKPLIVAPIAFVSEHSETLVELDMEYAKLAEEAGVPVYIRVPALGTHPHFIEALAKMIKEAHRELDV